jgi:hypothetical protein
MWIYGCRLEADRLLLRWVISTIERQCKRNVFSKARKIESLDRIIAVKADPQIREIR